jgi:hypothetical protein
MALAQQLPGVTRNKSDAIAVKHMPERKAQPAFRRVRKLTLNRANNHLKELVDRRAPFGPNSNGSFVVFH